MILIIIYNFLLLQKLLFVFQLSDHEPSIPQSPIRPVQCTGPVHTNFSEVFTSNTPSRKNPPTPPSTSDKHHAPQLSPAPLPPPADRSLMPHYQ